MLSDVFDGHEDNSGKSSTSIQSVRSSTNIKLVTLSMLSITSILPMTLAIAFVESLLVLESI